MARKGMARLRIGFTLLMSIGSVVMQAVPLGQFVLACVGNLLHHYSSAVKTVVVKLSRHPRRNQRHTG